MLKQWNWKWRSSVLTSCRLKEIHVSNLRHFLWLWFWGTFCSRGEAQTRHWWDFYYQSTQKFYIFLNLFIFVVTSLGRLHHANIPQQQIPALTLEISPSHSGTHDPEQPPGSHEQRLHVCRVVSLQTGRVSMWRLRRARQQQRMGWV